MRMNVVQLFLFVAQCVTAHAYIKGAPNGACDSMYPGHAVAGQTGTSGVVADLSSDTYSCGDTISIRLYNATFKGFLCQIRTDPASYVTVGNLVNTDLTNKCDQSGSITHTENSEKNEVSFVWQTAGNVGDVTLVCTIVKSLPTFWVKQQLAIITNTQGPCPTTTRSPDTPAKTAAFPTTAAKHDRPDNGGPSISGTFTAMAISLLYILDSIWS